MVKIDRVISDIRKALKEDSRGLTIAELAGVSKTTRITASMALLKLEGLGEISVRKIGNCKLHYLKFNKGDGRK